MKSRSILSLAAVLLAFSVPARSDSFLSGALGEASEALKRSRAEAASRRAAPAKSPIRVVVYHTNDIHGQLLPQPANPKTGAKATGGAASLATMLAQETLPWVWLDSGDWFQGTPVGNLTKGRAVVEMFNRLGLRATVVGNHEFDYGEANLREILRGADFTALGTNHYTWHEERANRLGHLDYLRFMDVQRIAGVKLGLIGLTTPDSPPSRTNPAYIEEGIPAMAALYLGPLRKLDVNAVIVLSHVGVEAASGRTFSNIGYGELSMARELPGVDLVLGGHLHVQVDENVRGSDGRPVRVSQTPGMLRSVNRIVLSFDPDTKALLSTELAAVALDPAVYPPDAGVLDDLRAIEAETADSMRRPIGASLAALERTDRRDSDLGNLVTDAWRAHAQSDFALTGTFGLRDGLPGGALTYEHIYRVFPFDNDLIRFKVRGADLRRALEACVSRESVYCQMSGMTMTYDPAGADKTRVREVRIGGALLEDERVYVGAADDYLVKIKKDIPEASGLEVVGGCRDVVAAYITARSPVMVPAGGRVRVASSR